VELIELTQKLVSIPSYLDKDAGINEVEVATFIESYVQDLGYLRVERQPVEGARFNVIAHDGRPPRLLFCCHMDTVRPGNRDNWSHDPFGGEVEGDRLFGRGAVDMKGGLACVLDALAACKGMGVQGILALFDVDEEKDILGMPRFAQDAERYQVRGAKLAVLPEPGLAIQNGHRGLMELHFRVGGVSAHASRPHLGKNAIHAATHAVDQLQEVLAASYSDPQLGTSTCNLAALRGGTTVKQRGKGIGIADGHATGADDNVSANMIPDIAEVVLDIRPASPALHVKTVVSILQSYLKQRGFTMKVLKIQHDRGALFVPPAKLTAFETIVREELGEAKYADISAFGYGEGQILNAMFGIPCVYFGPGPKEYAHQPDEYVSISELKQVRDVFVRLIERYCGASAPA